MAPRVRRLFLFFCFVGMVPTPLFYLSFPLASWCTFWSIYGYRTN